jgi:hypothetical protein
VTRAVREIGAADGYSARHRMGSYADNLLTPTIDRNYSDEMRLTECAIKCASNDIESMANFARAPRVYGTRAHDSDTSLRAPLMKGGCALHVRLRQALPADYRAGRSLRL